jgi:hypothetical protein
MQFLDWFDKHLQASADGLVWGVEQVPAARHYCQPPSHLGEWSVARHLFHMVYYEQKIALQVMREWLGAPTLVYEDAEEDAWQTAQAVTVEQFLTQFRAVRNEQLVLLPLFKESTWYKEHKTFGGSVRLLWVVSKTYQHTVEHTNDVLRMALFWDH